MAILPGQTTSRVPDGWTCFHYIHDKDDNLVECGAPAVVGFCTEADSFGAEIEYFCTEHFKDIQAQTPWYQNPESPTCDWHKGAAKGAVIDVKTVLPTRDPDEGSHGPVYYVCGACRRRAYEAEIEDDISAGNRCETCREWTGTYTGNYCTCCEDCGRKRNEEFQGGRCKPCASRCERCGANLVDGKCPTHKCSHCGAHGLDEPGTCWHCEEQDEHFEASEEPVYW